MKELNSLFTARETNLELVTTEKFAGLDVDFYRNGDDVFMTRKQIGEALGYKDAQKAMDNIHSRNKERLDKFSVTLKVRGADGKYYNTVMYNEKGVYEVLRKSNKPKADEFFDFVYSVIEALRKGELTIVPSYQINDPIERAKRWIEEEEERRLLENENKRMKPYANLGESVSDNDTLISVGELARVLKQRGVNIGQNRLFEWLRQEGFLIKRKGSDYNLPTQRALNMRLFRIVKNTATTEDGEEVISRTTKVTGKGQVYFINKLIKLTYNQPADNLTLF